MTEPTTPAPAGAVTITVALTQTVEVSPAVGATTAPTQTEEGPSASPNVANIAVPAGCTDLLVNGDMEKTGGWRLSNTPRRAAYAKTQVHSGTTSLRLGLLPGDANKFAHSSAYQPLTIPADAKKVTLRYWEWTGGGASDWDYREILLLVGDPRLLAKLERSRTEGNEQWSERRFDLTPYRGKTFFVYFNVFNNGIGRRKWSFIDDVSVTSCR